MSNLLILGIALALAMQGLAQAVASNIVYGRMPATRLFRFTFELSVFKAVMPVFGWLVGFLIIDYIVSYECWVAAGLLAFAGSKAVFDAYRQENQNRLAAKEPRKGWGLVITSTLKSTDGLAVGLSFAVLNVTIWYPCALIGLVTATLTVLGMVLGRRIGLRLAQQFELLGGVILMGISIQILLQHLNA